MLDFNNTTNDEDEWFINEDLNLSYFSALPSNSVSSDTSTDVDTDLVSAIHAMTSLYAPIRSSFMVHERASDAHGAFFKLPAKYEGQKLILIGRVKSEPITREKFRGRF